MQIAQSIPILLIIMINLLNIFLEPDAVINYIT